MFKNKRTFSEQLFRRAMLASDQKWVFGSSENGSFVHNSANDAGFYLIDFLHSSCTQVREEGLLRSVCSRLALGPLSVLRMCKLCVWNKTKFLQLWLIPWQWKMSQSSSESFLRTFATFATFVTFVALVCITVISVLASFANAPWKLFYRVLSSLVSSSRLVYGTFGWPHVTRTNYKQPILLLPRLVIIVPIIWFPLHAIAIANSLGAKTVHPVRLFVVLWRIWQVLATKRISSGLRRSLARA